MRLIVRFPHASVGQVQSGDQLAAIEEVKVLVLALRGDKLDTKTQQTLRSAVESFCESIVETSFGDFQVALLGDEPQIHSNLKDVGVSRYSLKRLPRSWKDATFAVVLSSQEDLKKIVMLQAKFKPFQKMGLRLPSVSWVSKFCQNALRIWKDHVRRSCPENNVIEYKESFGQDVASLYEAGSNNFSAAGENVELRMRFSLILFPLSCSIPAKILQKALPEVELDLDSLVTLEDKDAQNGYGKMAILSGKAFSEIHTALKRPRKLTVKLDESCFNILALAWSDWVFTFAQPESLRHEWESVQQELCTGVKCEAPHFDLVRRIG